jgi:hypothetical protein
VGSINTSTYSFNNTVFTTKASILSGITFSTSFRVQYSYTLSANTGAGVTLKVKESDGNTLFQTSTRTGGQTASVGQSVLTATEGNYFAGTATLTGDGGFASTQIDLSFNIQALNG